MIAKLIDLLNKIKFGMTRDEVKGVLGEPTDWSRGTRKYPTPAIYKYGEIELWFLPWKSGKLYMVRYTDHKFYNRKCCM